MSFWQPRSVLQLVLVSFFAALQQSGATQAEIFEDWREHIVSRSPIIEHILNQVRQVAGSDVSILITGATGSGSGKELLARAANGGTLFLDEIGDIPLPLQVKLMRALQERRIRPIGSTTTEPVDVRIISATNRDLEQDMREGVFREDLFYRLNVINFHLPSLSQARQQFEHDYLVKVLRLTNGSVAEAALLAQRNRTDFYKLLKRHNISPDRFKEST